MKHCPSHSFRLLHFELAAADQSTTVRITSILEKQNFQIGCGGASIPAAWVASYR